MKGNLRDGDRTAPPFNQAQLPNKEGDLPGYRVTCPILPMGLFREGAEAKGLVEQREHPGLAPFFPLPNPEA